jgi:hypothetical protein
MYEILVSNRKKTGFMVDVREKHNPEDLTHNADGKPHIPRISSKHSYHAEKGLLTLQTSFQMRQGFKLQVKHTRFQ